jgi:predicted Ser/Thr protein kinase
MSVCGFEWLDTKGFILSKTIEETWQTVLDRWGITHKEFRRMPKEDRRRFIKDVERLELVMGDGPPPFI